MEVEIMRDMGGFHGKFAINRRREIEDVEVASARMNLEMLLKF
jgi:hypothetical protein